MRLDLKDIIGIPGAEKAFECELDPERLSFPALVRFTVPPRAVGRVVNAAGVLHLTGSLTAEMLCICDRCGREFASSRLMELNLTLSDDMEDEDDSVVFPVEGDGIELDEVLETCFILDMDTKFLCREDCMGLCPVCGQNLNEGSCSCSKPSDPRWAVLGQLLDINDK